MNTRRVIEFDKIVSLIAAQAQLLTTQEKIMALEPMSDKKRVVGQLERVNDMRNLIRYEEGIELTGVVDLECRVLPKLRLIGDILYEEELAWLKESLRLFRHAKNKITQYSEQYKRLAEAYQAMPTYKPLEELIERVLDDQQKIKKEASLELSHILDQQQILTQQIQRKLEEMLYDKAYEHALQDRVVTFRQDRFVIPVKTTHKGQVKGIEHDRSESSMTVYIEPLAVVSLNNRLRELKVKEKEEKRKILIRLTDQLRIHEEGLKKVREGILQLDFDYSLALYQHSIDGVVAEITQGNQLILKSARHPLIAREKAVPVELTLNSSTPIFLITGPNTGGKTVLLKTIGLLSMMALCGISIPAKQGTTIPLFDAIYADIGDEQSIEQSLSSFSSHITQVGKIFSSITASSLVLLDELCSGTDPIEGAALALSMVEYLHERGCQAVLTTHYSEVKSYAFNQPHILTGSMAFDIATLSPTYQLLLGIPGESNAINICRRLQLPEPLLKRAQQFISEDVVKVEQLLQELGDKNQALTQLQEAVEQERIEWKKRQEEVDRSRIALEQERLEIEAAANQRAEALIENAQEKAKAIVAKLQANEISKEEAQADLKSLNQLKQALVEQRHQQSAVKKSLKKVLQTKSYGWVKAGSEVYAKSLKKSVKVINPDFKGQVLVQAGILKLALEFEDIEKIASVKKIASSKPLVSRSRSSGYKIDLRGQMSAEAVQEVEYALDSALLQGLAEVEIIHGMGTGALREAVWNYLKDSPYVSRYRYGIPQEGGFGVTIVTLK